MLKKYASDNSDNQVRPSASVFVVLNFKSKEVGLEKYQVR